LSINVIDQLKNYKGSTILKKEAISVLVKMLNPQDIDGLREAF
jgi:hypothetical protein